MLSLHPGVVARIIGDIETDSATVQRDPTNDLLRVNGEFTVSVVIARCQTMPTGSLRWKVRLDAGLRPSITIVVRMAADNSAIYDYYILPWLHVGSTGGLRLAPENGILLDAYRFDNLDPFLELTRRTPLRAVA